MRKSGLADLLPSLPEMVYVGSSAGSLVLTPGVTQDADDWKLFTAPTWNVGELPVLELAAPGPERESGIAAILAGTKTTMTGCPSSTSAPANRCPRPATSSA
jgi:hypothetical protein